MDTFSDTLADVTFSFNRSTREVGVSFTMFSSTTFSSGPGRSFSGNLPQGATTASLSEFGNPGSEYAIQVQCADDSCRQATIQIDKLSGTLAGRAVLKRETHDIAAFLNRNMPAGRLASSRDPLTAALAELTNRDNLSAVATASVLRLDVQRDNDRRTWFEIHYDFLPQPIMRADQPGYFDDKSVAISGEIGDRSLITATRQMTVHETAGALAIGGAYGKARLRDNPFAIAVTFERPDLRNPTATVSESMTAPLTW
jgi:hypothetical protein